MMMKVVNALSGFVGKNLTYIVVAVVVVAFFLPNLFTWAASHTVALLSVIMFGMGMTLKTSDFTFVFKRPKEVLAGCVAHYTIMPALAYGLTLAFHLPPDLAVGMVLLGSCPSGTASNVMSYLAKGDVPLAVCITTASTLLAPFLTPMITWALAGQWVHVSFVSMLLSVAQVILLPIVLGLLVHKVVGDTYVEQCSKMLVLLSAFAVLSIMGAMVALNGTKILELGLVIVAVVLLHNLGGFALGYFVTGKLGMGLPQRHSVTLEVGMQNSALACSLAALHFNPIVAIPGAVAGVVHQMTGSLLASIFAKRVTAKEEKELTKVGQAVAVE